MPFYEGTLELLRTEYLMVSLNNIESQSRQLLLAELNEGAASAEAAQKLEGLASKQENGMEASKAISIEIENASQAEPGAASLQPPDLQLASVQIVEEEATSAVHAWVYARANNKVHAATFRNNHSLFYSCIGLSFESSMPQQFCVFVSIRKLVVVANVMHTTC